MGYHEDKWPLILVLILETLTAAGCRVIFLLRLFSRVKPTVIPSNLLHEVLDKVFEGLHRTAFRCSGLISLYGWMVLAKDTLHSQEVCPFACTRGQYLVELMCQTVSISWKPVSTGYVRVGPQEDLEGAVECADL